MMKTQSMQHKVSEMTFRTKKPRTYRADFAFFEFVDPQDVSQEFLLPYSEPIQSNLTVGVIGAHQPLPATLISDFFQETFMPTSSELASAFHDFTSLCCSPGEIIDPGKYTPISLSLRLYEFYQFQNKYCCFTPLAH